MKEYKNQLETKQLTNMKAKRFILMLLVMLGSVGAWAQDPMKFHLTGIKSCASYEFYGYENALDENTNSYWDVIVAEGQDTYVEFMADSPVRVDEYRLIQYYPNTTSWEIRASEGELDDAGWNTADVISVKSDILENQRSNLFATEMSSDSRYQYFRLYLKNTEPYNHYLSEIEFYVTCAHDYDSEMVCSKCGYKYIHYHDFSTGDCSCGMPHPHLFDGDGVCTVENCGYDAKKLAGFITEVDNESIFGGSQSTNKNEICNLFDGNTGTKWQPTTGEWKEIHTVTAVFQTLQPVVVNGYSFYCEKRSGWGWRDSNDCVPKSWNLYGYNMTSQSWVLLDAIEDNAASPNCYNSYRFRNEEGQSYQYFKWEVTNTDYSGAIPPYQIQIGEFTLDAQDVQHAHRYSEDWYSDDNGHWRQCLNEFGECDAPIKDFTAHTHTIYAAVCDVCGHKNTHEHEWDDTVICRLCGIPHSHQFDGNGNCTVSGCGYSVSDTDGFLSGVNETIGGSTPSGDFMNLFDGDNDTKWSASPTAVAIFKTQTPARINGYSFTSSHPHVSTSDNKKSHPKSWKLYGLSEANTWVELHSVTDASVGEGWNNYRFVNNDGPKYSYFKLEVTDIYLDYYFEGYLNMGEFSVDVHNHNYEWMSDESEHWLECTNEEGKCNIKKKSEGTHTYDDTAEQGSEPYYICSICGHIDPVRQHIHDYSEEWSSDGTHHWHKCTSTLGTCVEPREGETTHSIHESYTCDADNYMCSICGYVDEAKKAQFDERDYFSLRAVDGNVTLGMQKTGAPDNCTLQVSADGNIWSEPMTLSETAANIVTIPTGETCYFRRGSTTAADRISTDYFDNYWSFTMDGSGNVEADGNIMSLLDMTCQQTTMDDNAFTKLFEGCTQLKTVSINSQALMDANYEMSDVFDNYVTTYVIGNGVTSICDNAFSGNSTVTSVTISEGVRQIGAQAFVQCNGLTSIVIPSTVQNIGDLAFGRCRNIIEFTMNCPSTCSFGSNALSGASDYKIIVPALTTHSWTSNPMWSTYGSRFTEPDFTLHANEDPDNAGNYYTTFFNSHYAYTLPNGVKAYTATIGEENNEKVVMLTAIDGDILPKGTAVLLHSNITGDMLMTVSNENGNEHGENLFSGVDVETAQSGTNYMLSYGQNGLGFYKMKENMMLSANKTFLPQSAAMANARALRIVFADDNEVNGIENINDGSTSSPTEIYNLSGMRQTKLQKGINIVNGKKIIVK